MSILLDENTSSIGNRQFIKLSVALRLIVVTNNRSVCYELQSSLELLLSTETIHDSNIKGVYRWALIKQISKDLGPGFYPHGHLDVEHVEGNRARHFIQPK